MSEKGTSILVIDDEEHLALGIAENLQAEGYHVEVAFDGTSGLEKARAGEWDLIVLDIMMPEMDGLAVCRTLRAEENNVAVLFLTARGDLDDRLRGLEAGGDDYLAKPFSLREFLLRVAAIVRRRQGYLQGVQKQASLSFDENRVDFRTYKGRAWSGAEHDLTHKEAMILKTLSDREGEVVSREEILEAVWGYEVFPSTRTIDNFIVRLRKRFERDPEHPRFFHTVRGVGYRFTLPTEDPDE